MSHIKHTKIYVLIKGILGTHNTCTSKNRPMAEKKRKHPSFITTKGSREKKSRTQEISQAMDVIAAKKVSGMIPEKKFFDTALAFNVDATMEIPATGQLALIPQGDTGSTRDGRQCTIESVQIRGEFLFTPGATALGFDVIYMYLIQDTQANGAAAAVLDVFTSTAAASNNLNLENSKRFRILKKWVVPMNCTAGVTTAYSPMAVPIEFFKKINIPMQFGTAAVDITQIRTNNLFLMAGTGQQDDLTQFAGSCRLRFRG